LGARCWDFEKGRRAVALSNPEEARLSSCGCLRLRHAFTNAVRLASSNITRLGATFSLKVSAVGGDGALGQPIHELSASSKRLQVIMALETPF
jgi:hypothetical protein